MLPPDTNAIYEQNVEPILYPETGVFYSFDMQVTTRGRRHTHYDIRSQSKVSAK